MKELLGCHLRWKGTQIGLIKTYQRLQKLSSYRCGWPLECKPEPTYEALRTQHREAQVPQDRIQNYVFIIPFRHFQLIYSEYRDQDMSYFAFTDQNLQVGAYISSLLRHSSEMC